MVYKLVMVCYNWVYDTHIYSIHGGYKPTFHWGTTLSFWCVLRASNARHYGGHRAHPSLDRWSFCDRKVPKICWWCCWNLGRFCWVELDGIGKNMWHLQNDGVDSCLIKPWSMGFNQQLNRGLANQSENSRYFLSWTTVLERSLVMRESINQTYPLVN